MAYDMTYDISELLLGISMSSTYRVICACMDIYS